MSEVIFEEIQKVRNKWLWTLMLFTGFFFPIIAVIGFIQQIIYGIPFGNNPLPDSGFIIVAITGSLFGLGIFYLFLIAKLEIQIKEDGVNYRYIPFINRFKLIRKEDIESYEVKKYNPIRDYGGWGIKSSFKEKGTAYSVDGNLGLQLIFNQKGKHKKILIGIRSPEEIQLAMNKMMNKSNMVVK